MWLNMNCKSHMNCNQSFVMMGSLFSQLSMWLTFFIIYKDGHEEVIDTKGCPDSVALLKRKLFWYKFPDVDYKWITWVKKFGGWIEYEEYKRLKREEKRTQNN